MHKKLSSTDLSLKDIIFSYGCYSSPDYSGLLTAFPNLPNIDKCAYYNPHIDALYYPFYIQDIIHKRAMLTDKNVARVYILFEYAHRELSGSPIKCILKYLKGILQMFVWCLSEPKDTVKAIFYPLTTNDALNMQEEKVTFFQVVSVVKHLYEIYFEATRYIDELFSLVWTLHRIKIEGIPLNKPFDEVEKEWVSKQAKDLDFPEFSFFYQRTKYALERIGYERWFVLPRLVYSLLPPEIYSPKLEAVMRAEIKYEEYYTVKLFVEDLENKQVIKQQLLKRLDRLLTAIEKERILLSTLGAEDLSGWLDEVLEIRDDSFNFCTHNCIIDQLDSYLKSRPLKIILPKEYVAITGNPDMPLFFTPFKYLQELLKLTCDFYYFKKQVIAEQRNRSVEPIITIFNKEGSGFFVDVPSEGFFGEDNIRSKMLLFSDSITLQLLFSQKGLTCPFKYLKGTCKIKKSPEDFCLHDAMLKNIWSNAFDFNMKVGEMPECLR